MASTNGPTTSLLRPDLSQYGAATNLSLNEAIQDRIKNGEEIFHMGFGQSPFPIFHRAVQALQNHAGENAYLPVTGKRSLHVIYKKLTNEIILEFFKAAQNFLRFSMKIYLYFFCL